MMTPPDVNLWSDTKHALEYLRHADWIPHRKEGDAVLLEFLPSSAKRILDLGSGDGRLLRLIKEVWPEARCVATDFSPAMLKLLQERFAADPGVIVLNHDMRDNLPPLEQFDSVVSSFAIHHLPHKRKRTLYEEIFNLLIPGGVFCNLEHVASATPGLHLQFLQRLASVSEEEDPSNKLLDVETQLTWLRKIGFIDVDCHWKWRELALFTGTRPGGLTPQQSE